VADSIVIIPTYNEKENIKDIIEAVFRLNKAFDVLIVDDNSPDGTGDIVEEMQTLYPGRLHLLRRAGKLGLGTAYLDGFRIGLDKGYEYLFEMDADFSHNPRDLERLYQACQSGADLVVGSRYVRGGGVKNWPKNRLWLSYGASLYVRIVTGMSVKDPTAGFVCYRRKVLETLDFDKIQFIGYAFQIEMKYASHLLGFSIEEIPITFVDRERGISKMNKSIVSEAVKGVIQIRMNSFKVSHYRRSSLN